MVFLLSLILFIFLLVIYINYFHQYYESFKNKNYYTFPQIQQHIRELLINEKINPDKIKEQDLNKFINRYHYLFPIKFNKKLFKQLDVYNKNYINDKAFTFLYFSINKKIYLDKSNYEYSEKL